MQALANWSLGGVEYSGLWLDMNEASSFCLGSWYVITTRISDAHIIIDYNYGLCSDSGTGANLSDTSVPVSLPGDPDSPVTDYPEG